MWLYVFIGADKDLPTVKWNDLKPGLHVSLTSEGDAATVTEWLQKPFIYDVGGHTGCACSLGYDADAENASQEELAEYAASREDLGELAAYLERPLKICSTIKI